MYYSFARLWLRFRGHITRTRVNDKAGVMDEDEELERGMLSISPSKQHVQSSVSASSSTARQQQASGTKRGRKCGFCQMDLKQGPNSPHFHTGFPGVTGKYIYCPGKVFSFYKDQGMEKETTWNEFQGSAFYETEKKRWEVEKGK